MTHFARIRPRLTSLTFPLIALAVISGVTSFFSVYNLSDWLKYTLWASAGVAAGILWLAPALKFVGTFVDVKSSGLTISSGLGAARRRELTWPEIASISYSPMRGIVIAVKEESELILRGYSNQKAIGAELQTLLRGK
jgi:hypothetical protein